MLTLTKERIAWVAIDLNTFDKEGEPETQEFRIKCELVDYDTLREMTDSTEIDDAEMVRRLARDWQKVKMPNGDDAPFNEENLEAAIQTPGFVTAWVRCYMRAWNGLTVDREGNSARSRGNGRAATKKAETKAEEKSPTEPSSST